MSEHHRVARAPGEPAADGAPGSRRWADYLDWVREDAIAAVTSLDPVEQRTPRVPSGWSPLELLHHLACMERRWFSWGFLGQPVDDPWADWDVDDPGTDPDGRWRVPDGVTADAVADALRAEGRRTRALLETRGLDEVAATGGRFAADPPTLEWICFHVLAELARHAGHLDVVVELARDERGHGGPPADG